MALKHNQVVWFTGLSGSGKSTLCESLAQELQRRMFRVEILDGDDIRRTLCADLGYEMSDRHENIKRIAFVANLLSRHDVVVLVAAISPLRSMRESVRRWIPDVIEVFVAAPLHICEDRDPKGLYKRARSGEIKCLTGIDSPFEPPDAPDVICYTDKEDIGFSTNKVLTTVLQGRALLRQHPI